MVQRPRIALNLIAIRASVEVAIAPIINDPSGPEPIANVITPRVFPRISSVETSMTIVDCIVEKPPIPIPRMIRSGNEVIYHGDNENQRSANNASAEPPANTRP